MSENGETNLKEPLQPPDLENTLSEKHDQLTQTPPFNSRVRALGCVSMRLFSDDDILLLIFDL